MAMNYSRFQSIFKGMTTAAQKVYSAVPARMAWTHDEISRELKRAGITNMDYRTMQGCVNSLCTAGLVRESPAGGHFVREEVRGKPVKPLHKQEEESKEEPVATQPSPTPVKPLDPIDRLTKLSGRVTSMASMLSELASDIDIAALDITEAMNTVDADTKKLKQLQTMLRELV